MASESSAVASIRRELLAYGRPMRLNLLSLKVRWGQGDMKEFGTIRTFLDKYPEVFQQDGTAVDLCSRPGAEASQPAPKAPPPAPQTPKAPPAAPEAPLAAGARASGAPADGAPARVPEEAPLEQPAAEAAGEPPPPAFAKSAVKPPWAAAGGPAPAPSKAAPPPWAAGRRPPGGEAAPAAPRAPTQPGGGGRPRAPHAPEAAAAAAAPPRTAPRRPAAAAAAAEPAGGCPPPPPPGPPASPPPPAASMSKSGALVGAAALGGSLAPPGAPASARPAGVAALSKSAQVLGGPPPGKPAPPAQRRATAPAKRERWEEDALRDDELSQAITGSKLSGMELELRALAVKIAPSEDYMNSCRQCLNQVKVAVATHDWGEDRPSLPTMVGSVMQETELEGCDIDMALRFPSGGSQASRESRIEEFWEKLLLSPQLAVYQTTRTFPHAKAPLTVELKGSSPPTVAHLLVVDPVSAPARQTTVDQVIKTLCDHFGPARDLVRLVKLWATNRSLSREHDGYPSGLAWTLITICFLQADKLVPPYKDVSKVQRSTMMPDILAMLRRFFEFLAAGQGALARGFSVVRGQEFQAPPGEPVFVEDPAELLEGSKQLNLAQGTGGLQWQRVVEEAKKVSDRLAATPQRWFHWAEVFDPREMPPRKMARLSEVVPRPPLRPGAGER